MTPSILRYFHPVIHAKQLGAKPVRVLIAGHPIVLFREADGKTAALDDLCPHRRSPLSQGRVRPDGRISCPYHGWNFDGKGGGRSPLSPELKQCDTRAYQVVEYLQHLWISELQTHLEQFSVIDDAGFEFAGNVSVLFEGSIELTLDNITEDEHFAFVHSSFGWDETGCEEVTVNTVRAETYTEVQYTGSQRVFPLGLLGGVRSGDHFHNAWRTEFQPVRTTYTFGWQNASRTKSRPVLTRAAVFLVPETADKTRLYMFLFVQIAPSLQAIFPPLIHWMARKISLRELKRDAALIKHVNMAPSSLSGMRLTKYDAALIHNRKLLRSLYWANQMAEHPEDHTPFVIPSSLVPKEEDSR
jgi:phenylpropionate dioxygenase-like ring-hydroxylating dioxygenase large terminal subunit